MDTLIQIAALIIGVLAIVGFKILTKPKIKEVTPEPTGVTYPSLQYRGEKLYVNPKEKEDE